MKLVTYLNTNNEENIGFILDGQVYDLIQGAREVGDELPLSMKEFLRGLPETLELARKVEQSALRGKIKPLLGQKDAHLLAPVPHPASCRDAYAFRQHVAAARRNRGVEMAPEFDQFPIFYYSNHNAIVGPGDVMVEEDHLEKLDFELEVACVIGKHGRNFDSENADDCILGFTIMNDLSARVLQMEEMKLSLGPAKGKDFATVIGPWLVTADELEDRKITTPFGNKYDLEMKAWHNGKLVSQGNVKDMNWTFAEIIERASYGADIFPGDVIGSGTVGTGCYMELNGTWANEAKARGESFTPVWLKDGDTIELEITGMGKLVNRIRKNPESHSILAKKKM